MSEPSSTPAATLKAMRARLRESITGGYSWTPNEMDVRAAVVSLPNLPGLISFNKNPEKSAAGTPILQPRSHANDHPSTSLMPLWPQHLGTSVEALQKAAMPARG